MKFSKLNLEIPDINAVFVSGANDYSKPNIRAGNIGVIRNINSKYGSIISKWSAIFEIDREIIIGFIATESGGKNFGPNGFLATGLMQVTPGVLPEIVPKWTAYQKTPMPSEAVNYMNKKASFIMAFKRDVPLKSSSKTTILSLLENDPEFNIMAGTMYLRWLLEKFKANGVPQLNKAMIGYNAGAYNRVINSTKLAISTKSLVNNKGVPSESRGYLLKMLGVDGFLELIFKEKLTQ